MNLLLLSLACLLPQEAEEPIVKKTVQVRQAVFYKKASRLGGVLRKAEYREEITETAVKGRFSRCVLKDGSEAWILSSALIASKKFKPGASTEEELKERKADGFEAGRFSPETEKRYRADGGARTERAYTALEALEKRRPDPLSREDRLRKFLQEGKLGEFSPVRD